MSIKQNNDELKNPKKAFDPLQTAGRKNNYNQFLSQTNNQNTFEQQSASSLRISKRNQSISSTKNPKQSQVSIKTKNNPPAPGHQAMLPITINQLDQKMLNIYLKQFMQISSFQSIQKGKQLIELIKQSPTSKQTTSIINKCFKLFKSSIPDAVLCSFQFFRQLIEIGHFEITDAIEKLLLIEMIQIIQYRSYLPQMERGNNFFLTQINRYSQDDKTNHLVKIGSTFFRMVHEVLYVWGKFYFPESNFSKKLNQLIDSKKIQFPQFPNQFRFYSQHRVELFRNLIRKNKKLNQIQEQEIKSKKNDRQNFDRQKIDHETINCNGKTQNKKIEKTKAEKVEKEVRKEINKTQKHFSELFNPSRDLRKDSKNELFEKQQSSIQKIKQNIKSSAKINQMESFPQKSLVNQQNQQQEQDLQSIVLKRQVKQIKHKEPEQKRNESSSKNVQDYKKIKPTKIKSKNSSFSKHTSGKSVEMQKSRVQSFIETENALQLIEEVEKIEMFKSKLKKSDLTSLKEVQIKNIIQKEALRQQLKIIKNERSRSESFQNNKLPKTEIKIWAEQTFRKVDKSKTLKAQQESMQAQANRTEENKTMQVMSSERERYIDFVPEQSQKREKLIQKESDTISYQKIEPDLNQNTIKLFLKRELQNIKNSIIQGVKSDITQIFQEKKYLLQTEAEQLKQQRQILQNQQKQLTLVKKNIESVIFPTNYIDPSFQAFQFIQKKIRTGKKLRTSSKLRRPSIIYDQEFTNLQKSITQIKSKQKQDPPKQPQKVGEKITADLGVNTDQTQYYQIPKEITSFKQKINLNASSFSQPQPLSVRKANNLFELPLASNYFFKTPMTGNKNQIFRTRSQISQLKSTENTARKKSRSKLSQRRSSLETSTFQKAISRPDACKNVFQQIYGGPSSLLFNAAINSVEKKRKSIMFC